MNPEQFDPNNQEKKDDLPAILEESQGAGNDIGPDGDRSDVVPHKPAADGFIYSDGSMAHFRKKEDEKRFFGTTEGFDD